LPAHPEAEKAMGQFIIAWGRLEAELDLSFPVLFRVDSTLACCIYANLGTKAKLDIIGPALHMLRKAFDEKLYNELAKYIGTIRDLSGNARNVIAHGQPITWDIGSDQPWEIVRSSARTAHEFVFYPSDPAFWRKKAREVVKLARAWRKAMAAVHLELYKLTGEDFELICYSASRDARPKRPNRRSRPRQSKSGSSGRRTKRAQSGSSRA
jgi:hypothetical protein